MDLADKVLASIMESTFSDAPGNQCADPLNMSFLKIFKKKDLLQIWLQMWMPSRNLS